MGNVHSRVVIAENLQGRSWDPANSHVSEQREEISRSAQWILADDARRMGSRGAWGKIAQSRACQGDWWNSVLT